MIRATVRYILVGIGCVSLVLGVIGIFLPLLPTVPFVLLSALCFSKGSKRMHAWLLRQPHVGPIITDWDQYRCVSVKAKIWCASLMTLTMGYTSLFLSIPIIYKIMMVTTGACVMTFVLTRPARRVPRILPGAAPETEGEEGEAPGAAASGGGSSRG